MKIRSGGSFFTFRLERNDYRKYGEYNINKFIEAIKSNIPIHQRNYFPETFEWQIYNDCRREFDRLVSKHLTKNQLGLFD